MSYDVAVIGAGPGGYIAAIRARQLGLKTCMFEERPTLGGTCLNVGCIPSKTLLHASEHIRLPFDFGAIMARKSDVVAGLADSVDHLCKKNGVELIKARAELLGPHQIKANDKVIDAKSIILAAGSEVIALPFLPFDEKVVLSSTGALALDHLPKSMVVVGGGVIGVELASIYARLGTKVTVLEMLPQICTGVDSTLASQLFTCLKEQNIAFKMNVQVLAGRKKSKGVELTIREENGDEVELEADVVLVAIGRRPRSQDLGVMNLNIDVTPRGAIVVDKNFRTTIPNIYAIGDLIDGPMLAHRASYEAVAVAEIIAGKSPSVEYIHIPNIIYTNPELATVGFSEEEARQLNRPVVIGKCAFKANPRARASDATDGLVKIIGDKESGRILGLHILSSGASEMIHVGVVALSKRMTLAELGDLPFGHPTYSEAIKEAALAALGRSYHL